MYLWFGVLSMHRMNKWLDSWNDTATISGVFTVCQALCQSSPPSTAPREVNYCTHCTTREMESWGGWTTCPTSYGMALSLCTSEPSAHQNALSTQGALILKWSMSTEHLLALLWAILRTSVESQARPTFLASCSCQGEKHWGSPGAPSTEPWILFLSWARVQNWKQTL